MQDRESDRTAAVPPRKRRRARPSPRRNRARWKAATKSRYKGSSRTSEGNRGRLVPLVLVTEHSSPAGVRRTRPVTTARRPMTHMIVHYALRRDSQQNSQSMTTSLVRGLVGADGSHSRDLADLLQRLDHPPPARASPLLFAVLTACPATARAGSERNASRSSTICSRAVLRTGAQPWRHRDEFVRRCSPMFRSGQLQRQYVLPSTCSSASTASRTSSDASSDEH